MKKIILVFCLGFFFQIFQAFSQKKKQLTVAFYNVENLFDTQDDPAIDDEEFLPEGKNKWTEDRYQKKLENISIIIDSIGGGPAVLGVCEVENKQVLEDLVKTKRLAGKNYKVIHEHSPDKRGIDVAIIFRDSDFIPDFHKMIRVLKSDDPEFITRDIMLVKGKLQKQPVYFFINHWPSRRGGEDVSASKRMAAALVARHSIDTILAANPGANIILMGDFNDEPTDSSLVAGLGASLKSDLITRNLYNTMAPIKQSGDGSHYFNSGRHMLDQIIVSKSFLNQKSKIRLQKGSSSIYRPVWIQDQNPKFQGSPFRTYAGTKYLGGFSDHFPVYCIVEF